MDKFHIAVIAGTHSSVGKTTWSLALMAFFRQKGLQVQPFKVGPDYIDTAFHHRVCRPRRSRNLDRFFLSKEYLKECFNKNSADADLVLVEGVMGLFDSRDPLSEEGSTAEMAKLLNLPVFLVIDGAGLARSAAALVKGYRDFDPDLHLAGVLVNRAGSVGHYEWLQKSIEKETGIPVLGWLPTDSSVSIPERHLGLRTVLEEKSIEEKISNLLKLLEGNFDEKRFLELSTREQKVASPPRIESPERESAIRCRIGIAYDRAFSFYYEDNWDLLREAGAELVFFSPLSDSKLPPDLDALYWGGGFPELYANDLSEHHTMKAAIHQFHQEGGIIYSECGGHIYLCESLTDSEGREFPLLGLVPGKVLMTNRLQHFGYHEVEGLISTFLFPKGKKLRSHEFHYSLWEPPATGFQRPYRTQGRWDGFYDGRILSSYQHLHFGQDGDLARSFVQAAAESRRRYAPSK